MLTIPSNYKASDPELKEYARMLRQACEDLKSAQARSLEYAVYAGKVVAETKEHLKTSTTLWRNLVDWVKANLIKEEKTHYYQFMSTKLLAYVPDTGYIHGVGCLYTSKQLFTLLSSMVRTTEDIALEEAGEVEMTVDEYFQSK